MRFHHSILCFLWLLVLPARAEVVNATINSINDVAVVANGYTATGNTVNITLNYAPAPGVELMIVNNTGRNFIQGTFDNLAQGQILNFSYGGRSYQFFAHYFGGTGNDLVLAWANARLWAWGSNANGTLGNGSTTNSSTPVEVAGIISGKTVISAAAGSTHSLAVCSDGTLAAWGTGPLGNAAISSSNVPISVNTNGWLFGKTIISVAAGAEHSMVLASDGSVYTWGNNSEGQLGNNTLIAEVEPDRMSYLDGIPIVAIAAGSYHSMALAADGSLYAWGENISGQLGTGTQGNRRRPTLINGGALAGKSVVAISAGGSHSMALFSDGTAAAWGSNGEGQIKDDVNDWYFLLPTLIDFSESPPYPVLTFSAISAGGLLSLGSLSDGKVGAMGYFLYFFNSSTQLPGQSSKTVVAGASHALALSKNGVLFGWGDNTSGQAGSNSGSTVYFPQLVNTSQFPTGSWFTHVYSGSSASHSFGSLATQPAMPEIAVHHYNEMMSGVGSFNLWHQIAGHEGYYWSSGYTLTIQNTGGAALTDLTVTIGGANPDDFGYGSFNEISHNLEVGVLNKTTLLPGESTRLELLFGPRALGVRNAIIQISSSDFDETPFEVHVTGLGVTAQESWRRAYFGAVENAGNGADDATPMNDGVSNLLKYATGMRPDKPGLMPGVIDRNGDNITFTYTRSKYAEYYGITYMVEWSDTLVDPDWSTAGVTETAADFDYDLELVTATLPAGPNGQRFVHLKVTAP